MKKVIFVFIVTLTGCSMSCNYNQNKNQKIGDTIVSNDTLIDGTISITKKLKNVLVDSFTVSNNKIIGFRKKLSRDEGYMIWEYVDGVQNGQIKYYYKNNKLLYSGFLRSDTIQIGPWIYYYPNGQAKAYNYFNSYGVLSFTKKYNELGYPYLCHGQAVIQARYGSDSIKIGDNFDFFFDVATPPYDSVKVFISDVVDLHGKQTMKNLKELVLANNTVSASKQINKIGLQAIGLYCKMSDRSGKVDSSLKIIEVVGVR